VVVSPLGQSDRLVWRGSTDGLFSVKSSYHLAISRRAQEKGESSREAANCRIWKSIWRLRVPPVARHFCWKVCHNLLPTMVNLTAKKVVPNLECPICSREPETAVIVWQESSKRIQKLGLMARDGKELLTLFIEKLDDTEVGGGYCGGTYDMAETKFLCVW